MLSAVLSQPDRDSPDVGARWKREQEFHDRLAGALDPATMPPTQPIPYDETVLDAAGIGPGCRVLDLGCGQGDLTLALIARGAQVTAVDISPAMLQVAERRVEQHANNGTARFIAAPVERTGLATNSFDAVVGRWILHHVDLSLAAAEIARLLAPSGRMVVFENSGRNAALRVARDHLAGRFRIPRYGTVDERPLTTADWACLTDHFGSVVATYPIFEFFVLLDRQVFRYRSKAASRVCRRLDAALGRVRCLRRYSYRVLVVASVASSTPIQLSGPA